MTNRPGYFTVQAAAEFLGTSPRRIWQLIKEGRLDAVPNPLDRRSKLIPIAQLEELAPFAHATKPAARSGESSVPERRPTGSSQKVTYDRSLWPKSIGSYKGPVEVHSDEVEDYLREHWKPDW